MAGQQREHCGHAVGMQSAPLTNLRLGLVATSTFLLIVPGSFAELMVIGKLSLLGKAN